MKAQSISIVLLFCLFCCKDETTNRVVFETSSVTQITSEGALVKGTIISLGSSPITDYGFVVGNHDRIVLTGAKGEYHLGNHPAPGEFSQTVTYDQPLSDYYVRAFVILGNLRLYAKAIKFSAPGFESSPQITDFTPKEGSSNTSITITGDYFDPDHTDVKIGSYQLAIVSATKTQIIANLPANVSASGFFPVRVTSNAKVVSSAQNFRLTGPIITSFSPQAGKPGTTVVISGEYFAPSVSGNIVRFGNVQTTVTAATPQQLTVVLGTSYVAGPAFISVTTGLITGSSTTQFTIEGPVIDDFTPKQAYGGATVTITGRNFSPTLEENHVLYKNQHLELLTASETQLTVRIPGDLGQLANSPAPIYVTVYYFGVDLSSPTPSDFTILTPWQTKRDFPGQLRILAAGFSIGNYAYVGTGSIAPPDPGFTLKDFWSYNATTDSWTQLNDFPGGSRYNAFSFTINGKGYIGGGMRQETFGDDLIVLKDFWEYDPGTDTWTQKADFPSTAGPMDFNRMVTAMAIGSRGYIVDEHLVYDYNPATNLWTQHSTHFPGPILQTEFSIGVNGKGYYGFGSTTAVSNSQLWEYDPSNETWTPMPDYPEVLTDWMYGFTINGKLYVGIDLFYEFDPGTQVWTPLTTPGTISGGVGFAIGENGYVTTGGGNSGGLHKLYSFKPN